ncbi:MAG: cyclodeaminase/cyclohydrolase family protein [Phycisphaerales bacterium]|nr:cyclodeaminase/cyclohydrolase family protein [Phycisphaerales bacterium]
MNIREQTLQQFLSDLSAKRPTPGGGAVVGLVGALAASLGSMVVNYSLGKKNLADHETELSEARNRLDRFGQLLLDLADQDAAAYGVLSELLKLDADDARRRSDLPVAVVAAIRAPQASLAACADLLRLLDSLTGKTNRYLASDLAIAAQLADAAARAAEWNVRINLPLLESEADRRMVVDEIAPALETAASLAQRIEAHCRHSR